MKLKRRKLLWLLSVLVVPMTYGGLAMTGSLEPPAPPGSTMKTLDEIPPAWSQKITDASKRFQIVMDGEAVLDKETGLVWEKSPDTTTRTWSDAVHYAYNKTVGGRKGWRLPTIEELASLTDPATAFLPFGHPFTNVGQGVYWSYTTTDGDTSYGWIVNFDTIYVHFSSKSSDLYVWCVRGGHGHNGQ
ncbi:MAG: hypothetical protein CV087_17075 [Candidatus Brocadia sp. WS118]|nr:MAG: hypothetical protein CV087_17075 [Candidatus Brocadia sp. WS118]